MEQFNEYLKTFGWGITGAITMAVALPILLKVFDLFTPINEWEEIKKALLFASEKHKDQRRKYTGEYYIIHPVSVCDILRLGTTDKDILNAALLHDTIEDTNTTYQ
ncbi:MAG: HD domain-containing protein, partial [Patescibacteria group bacterium]